MSQVSALLLAGLILTTFTGPACADDGGHGHAQVECPGPQCQLVAGTASSGALNAAPHQASSQSSKPICTYVPVSEMTTAADGSRGQWYSLNCGEGFNRGQFGGPVLPMWAGAGKPAPEVSPVVLAQQAESQLVLPSPQVSFSPAGFQVVRVPTWMWTDPVQWRPVTATAQVPGVSVTATGAPSSVQWDLGDGTQVTCAGPGTPWRPADDPGAASPDCGHVFQRPSADQPGGTYAVTVRVHWRVDWAGGGQQGVFPDLSSTTTVQVRVKEVHSLVTSNQTR